jgi:hypothetical protein
MIILLITFFLKVFILQGELGQQSTKSKTLINQIQLPYYHIMDSQNNNKDFSFNLIQKESQFESEEGIGMEK